jgi:hypothetical protein
MTATRRNALRAALATAAACVAACALPAGAGASGVLAPVTRSLDLLTEADAEVQGSIDRDAVGTAIASADLNGDGHTDLITTLTPPSGNAEVLYGRLAPLENLAVPGGHYRIHVCCDSSPRTLDAADINGDGRADALASNGASASIRVSFGKTDEEPAEKDFSVFDDVDHVAHPISVAVLNDTNGDGLREILAGEQGAGVGAAYVIFGRSDTAYADRFSQLGAGGYRIEGSGSGSLAGYSVASAGDVNGDGRGDMLIGAPGADDGAGAAWVVFGKNNTTPVKLGQLNNSGYKIKGAAAGDAAGSSVANAGDVNGDGVPDQIVGAPTAGDSIAGAAYVVFGKRTDTTKVDLGALGSGGYEVTGVSAHDQNGVSVAGGRDVNGDGHADAVVGATGADNDNRPGSGSAYVVYGKASKKAIDLGSFPETSGYRIDGPTRSARAGTSVVLAANLFGSTVLGADVVVGAPNNDSNGLTDNGSVYVIDEGGMAAEATMGDVRMSNGQLTLRSAALAAARASGRTTIKYKLRRPAKVTFRFARIVLGRRKGKGLAQRCVKPSRKLRKARHCHRLAPVGTLTRTHKSAGSHHLSFAGRLRGHALPAGRYLLEVKAREPNGRLCGPARLRFSVKQ